LLIVLLFLRLRQHSIKRKIAWHCGIDRELADAHFLYVSRNACGILHESWEALQKGYFGTRLSKKCDPHLPVNAQAALSRLKRYFSKSPNVISTIRNKLAFHYSSDQIQRQLAHLVPEQVHSMVFGRIAGNTFCTFAHQIQISAVAEATGASTLKAASDELFRQIHGITTDLINIVNALLLHLIGPVPRSISLVRVSRIAVPQAANPATFWDESLQAPPPSTSTGGGI
jgi:hypothetical protein